ncbi:transglycosylase SLT domain-containing protein [Streptomyces sp. B8F3]|uniref:transglycosylase SLT domain-containing protein n=1 Tax=unclassified Streptomyces TaxID=2593676 RepID=UPI00325EEDE7
MSAPTLLRPAAARRRLLAAGGWAAAAVALTVAVAPQAAAAAPQSAAPAAASAHSTPSTPSAVHATTGTNLDEWIKQALDVMDRHDIPGTYDGIHRNILRESSGDPHAINNWDINAVNGVPSQGLLQVIPPTFDAYHVTGTTKNIVDPVANIVAACNYAADRYGSIDNVWGAY